MQLMSIEDLAAYLGDSKRTIYKYIASGDCPPYMRISAKNIKFDRADVDAWLESKKVFPDIGGKEMCNLKTANNTKEIIKNAIQSTKLPWTPRAKAVLKSAEKLACKDGFEFVGTEHILIGIVSVKDCLGSKILKNLGVETDNFIELYDTMCKSSGRKDVGQIKFSEDIERIIQCACKQAVEWGHEYVGAEHLLIAILFIGEGLGFQMLNKLSITLDKVREETQRLIVCRNTTNERKEK